MSQAAPALWGFASMFAWGVADMLARYASVRMGSTSVALMVLGLGIAPPLLMALSREPSWSALTGGDFVVLATVSSLLFSVGYVAFHRGLERGMVSVGQPLVGGLPGGHHRSDSHLLQRGGGAGQMAAHIRNPDGYSPHICQG